MTIRHLKVFICVCNHKSITKAAQELYVAQPSVSKTISELEHHYGVILFNRIGQRISLTDEGETLLVKAGEVISAFEEFEMQAQNASYNPLIRIGSSITIGKQQMPNLLKNLREQFEGINFQISVNQTAVIESKIADGTLDFAFIQGKASNPHITSKLVSSNNLIAVCGRDYEIEGQVTLKQLSKKDLLLREDDSVSREFLSYVFGLHNIKVEPIMESVSNEALISAASENLGVTILPEPLLDSHINRGTLRKIDILDCELTRNSYLIFHRNKTFRPVKRQIFDFCFNNYNYVQK